MVATSTTIVVTITTVSKTSMVNDPTDQVLVTQPGRGKVLIEADT